MADLEGAAGDTLDKLKELVAHIDRAHQKFGDLREKVDELASTVQRDWIGLQEQVGEFLQAVGEQQGRLSTEVQEAAQATAGLEQAAAQASGEAENRLDAGETQVDAFAEQVTATEPAIGSLAESVEASFKALTDQAASVREQMEKAFGDARDFLQDEVVEGLQELQEDLRERGDAMEEALGECADALRESYQDWNAGLTEVEATVEKAFADAAEHLDKNVDLAFDECLERHLKEVQEFKTEVDALEAAVQELAEAAEACGEVSEEAVGTHEQQMQSTEESLEAVQGKLAEIKTLLASYTFVQM